MTAVNGWSLFAHPLLLDQLERLTTAVETARMKDPDGYQRSPNARLLAALRQLMFETIPRDATRAEYRQAGTLGRQRKHWFRAKFGAQRFRLFFRYSSTAKVIVYAWVNDRETLRTYGARTDAYAVFRAMLDQGSPPEAWDQLPAEASAKGARARFGGTE